MKSHRARAFKELKETMIRLTTIEDLMNVKSDTILCGTTNEGFLRRREYIRREKSATSRNEFAHLKAWLDRLRAREVRCLYLNIGRNYKILEYGSPDSVLIGEKRIPLDCFNSRE